ncbi:MAG: alpha/beta hydrolase [Bacteroidia bacterium]|nr:alpha/beta hydrolase [Bacteroidia bacterium]
MPSKYQLNSRLKFLLFLLNIARPSSASLNLRQIQSVRKPFPIQFLAEWVLGRGDTMARVEDRRIPVRDGAEIPIRIYWPSQSKNLPIILNFHGGGWAVGNLQQSDYYCRKIAREVGALVISVDYRLAPEHRFPVPLQDCYDALVWAHQHAASLDADPNRIAVTGDSAGGNLSAVLCLMARDLNGPKISFQGLIYPATDGTFNYPSYQEHTHAPILTQQELHFYRSNYESQPGDHLHPYFSPYLANDLSHLPPAVIVTAEYDPLCDDGRRYAERLKAEGNQVEFEQYEKALHGFITLVNHCPQSAPATRLLVKGFKKHL